MSARSTGAAPRQRGSSDGWTLSHSARSSSSFGISRPYAQTTTVSAASSTRLVEPRGLRDRDPEPLGRLLRGRRREAAAAPRGLSGRVSSCTTSCSPASRSSTSAPNAPVAATAIRRATLPAGRCAAAGCRAPRGAPRASSGRGSGRRRGGRPRAGRRASTAPRARSCTSAPCSSRPSIAIVAGRSTGSSTPWIERQPSSSTVVSSLRSTISGFASATISSSSAWKTNSRCRTPTCVAASPIPLASTISCFIRSTSRRSSSSNSLDRARGHLQRRIRVLADLREREPAARGALGVELLVLDLSLDLRQFARQPELVPSQTWIPGRSTSS